MKIDSKSAYKNYWKAFSYGMHKHQTTYKKHGLFLPFSLFDGFMTDY